MTEPTKPHGETEVAIAAAALPANYFELYKLAVEMADRTSVRRGVANSFFLTVNTGIAALLGASDSRWYVAAAGIAFCVTWWALLKSYRELNNAKFAIILEMEERLPVRVFGDEWDHLRPSGVTEDEREIGRRRRDALRRWFGQYWELGRVERIVPAVFGLIYAAEVVRQLLA